MEPSIDIAGARVFLGDCRDVLKTLPDNSVDSIVTDPPYELGFMGKKWDSSGIAYDVTVWAECLRVLKPGGHVLAFGGSRTWHRLAVAVEDAGFELRDSIAWIYGSGFPKSLDVSKAIDKNLGAEREAVVEVCEDLLGVHENPKIVTRTGKEAGTYGAMTGVSPQTQASSSEAKAWQGWGTALKPAFEPVVVGRKPLVGTVAENVLAWGVGGLNIDGSRIGNSGGTRDSDFDETSNRGRVAYNMAKGGGSELHVGKTEQLNQGRWPANVILDEVSAGLLDEQSGVSKSSSGKKQTPTARAHFNRQLKLAREMLSVLTIGVGLHGFFMWLRLLSVTGMRGWRSWRLRAPVTWWIAWKGLPVWSRLALGLAGLLGLRTSILRSNQLS
jgi:hypothetical protein